MEKKFWLKIVTVILFLVNISCICSQLLYDLERRIAVTLDIVWIVTEVYLFLFVYINLFYIESKNTKSFIDRKDIN